MRDKGAARVERRKRDTAVALRVATVRLCRRPERSPALVIREATAARASSRMRVVTRAAHLLLPSSARGDPGARSGGGGGDFGGGDGGYLGPRLAPLLVDFHRALGADLDAAAV